MNVSKVRYIIDIDGFPYKSEVIYKELGIFDMQTQKTSLFHIKLPNWFITMGKSKSSYYCEKFIHGLSFKNYTQDYDFNSVIQFLNDCDISREFVWGYKGGTVENKLLTSLQMKSLNLQTIGCPNFDTIMCDYNLTDFKNCSRFTAFHKNASKTCQCAGVEVEVFTFWLEKYYTKCNV